MLVAELPGVLENMSVKILDSEDSEKKAEAKLGELLANIDKKTSYTAFQSRKAVIPRGIYIKIYGLNKKSRYKAFCAFTGV